VVFVPLSDASRLKMDREREREANIKDGIGRKRESRCSERTMEGGREREIHK